jgi:DNA segregation ATPase FtsK/SpoIIIE, S-DNA-T family
VVDDAEVLARTPADDAIKDFLRASGRGRVAVVVGGQLDDLKTELRGTIVEAKKAKAGLLLSPPSTLDGDVVGLRLPRNLVGRMPPGRAILGLQGEARVVQVPR